MDSALGHSNRPLVAGRPRLSAHWGCSREHVSAAIQCLAAVHTVALRAQGSLGIESSLIPVVPLAALRLPPRLPPAQLTSVDLLGNSCRAQRRLMARSQRGGAASALNAATPSRVSAQQASLQSPLQRLRILVQQFTSKGAKPPSTMCNFLLQECEHDTRWPDVWQSYLALETTGVKLTQLTYYTLWKAAIREGWVTQATQLFRRCTAVWGVREQKEYTSFICLLLKHRHKLGLPTRELAYQMWREMLDHHAASLDAVALRTGIAACCAVGRLQEAEELLRWGMKTNIHVGHGSFHRIMTCHVERGDMVAAYQVFDRLRTFYTPTTIDWNVLVWGHAQAGDVAAAAAAVERARVSGCDADAWTWSSLVYAYTRAGDMDGAESAVAQAFAEQQAARLAAHTLTHSGADTANGMPRGGGSHGPARGPRGRASPDTTTTTASSSNTMNINSSNGSSSTSRDEHVGGSSQRAGARGVQGPESPGSSAGSEGVRQQQQQQRRPHVKVTVSTHMYAALVDGYMRLGRAAEAERAASRMYTDAGLPPSVVVYNTLMRGYCKLGVSGQARALELLSEMRAAGCEPNVDTYTTLLTGAADLPGGGWSQPGAANTTPPPAATSLDPTTPAAATSPAAVAAAAAAATIGNSTAAAGATRMGTKLTAPGVDAAVGMPAVSAMPPSTATTSFTTRPSFATTTSTTTTASTATTSTTSTSSSSSSGSVQHTSLNGTAATPAGTVSGTAAVASLLRGRSNSENPVMIRSTGDITSQRTNGPIALPLPPTSDVNNTSIPTGMAAGSSQGLNSAQQQPLGRPSLAGEGLVPSLMKQLYARGQPADAAVLTTLMMLHSRAGRYQWALAVFEELRASSATRPDAIAWAALASVHAKAGALQEAAAAAEQAAAAAHAIGTRVPDPAFGVLVHAHAAAGDLQGALAAFKRLLVLGGRPHKRVLDVVVRMCLERDQPDAAARALRATELAGVSIDRDRYSKWVSQWQALQGHRQQPSPQADGFERLKWWLGLPNRYYSSDWGSLQRRPGAARRSPSPPPPSPPQQQQQQEPPSPMST